LALSLVFFFSSSFQLGDFYTFWHLAWFTFLFHLFNLATSILFGTQLGLLFFFICLTWRLQYFLALSLVFFFSSAFQLSDINTFWHLAWFFFLQLFNLATSMLFGT